MKHRAHAKTILKVFTQMYATIIPTAAISSIRYTQIIFLEPMTS